MPPHIDSSLECGSARRFVIFILTLHKIKTEIMISQLVLPSTADPVPKNTNYQHINQLLD